MRNDEFKKYGYEIIDWIAEYFSNIEQFPVKSNVNPGDIKKQLPINPPENSENFDSILSDFNSIIMPGITHWQSPNFYAYFNANNSYESILGELLTSAIGVNCFIWQNSPAGTELEEVVMNWLRDMIGLPKYFSGVIQDTASTATLCSILTAREKFTDYQINKSGFTNANKFRVYASSEAHSSIEKAVKIAGIGSDNLVKIKVDENFDMNSEELEITIENDIQSGFIPLIVISALGTTGSTGVDSLLKNGEICKKYDIFHHVDAAHAGTALVLEDFRHYIDGIENVDSFVFNPHKWMFTNFDFSAYFVKNTEYLIRTFEIMPEYLKTNVDNRVNNYRDWGIQLGRRFRALKMWFVIRSYGLEGIKSTIQKHLDLTKTFSDLLEKDKDFELLAPVRFNLVCFRYNPGNFDDLELNSINEKLMERINSSGKAFLTHTKLNGKYTLRVVIGQTYIEERNVLKLWHLIKEMAKL